MTKLILASHGDMAIGMKDSANLIIGNTENLFVISLKRGDSVSIKKQLTDYLEQFPNEKIVIMTDVFGGSVNTDVMEICATNDNTFVICGINLSLVLALLTYNGEITNLKINQLIDEASKQIINCKQAIKIDDEIMEDYL